MEGESGCWSYVLSGAEVSEGVNETVFVPAVQLSRVFKHTVDGFLALLFPLLLRRRDVKVSVHVRVFMCVYVRLYLSDD